MKGTGIFVKKEELESVIIEFRASGMYMPNIGTLGNPERKVAQLAQKYNAPKGTGLNLKTGEFVWEERRDHG